jgi:thioredoxin 2
MTVAQPLSSPDGIVRACPRCGRKNRLLFARLDRAARCGACGSPLPAPAEPLAVDSSVALAELLRRSALPVLVDFWAPWCGPCRMVSPALAQVAADLAGRVKLVKVNVDESPKIQQRFGVQAIPTLMVLRRGQVAARRAGAAPAADLRKWVEAAIAP